MKTRLRWWHLMLILISVPVVAFSFFVGLVVVSLSGGIDDVLSGDSPSPDDPAVVEAERRAAARLDRESARLAATVVVPALGADVERVGRGVLEPQCQVGQHNWKIDDNFDLSCRLSRIEVVAVPDTSAFQGQMVALDQALQDRGWAGEPSSLELPLRYWDLYLSPTTDPAERPSMEYSVDDLPTAGYDMTVDGQHRDLAVAWAERTSGPEQITYLEDEATFEAADGDTVTVHELVGAIPADGYAVVVTETVEYFRE